MIKPFYIEITEGMSVSDVGEALDLCVEHGATPYEQVGNYESNHDYLNTLRLNEWLYFGVEDAGCTYFSDDEYGYGKEAILITLDQLHQHIGIEPQEALSEELITSEDDCTTSEENLSENVTEDSDNTQVEEFITNLQKRLDRADADLNITSKHLEILTGNHKYIVDNLDDAVKVVSALEMLETYKEY